MSIFAPETAGTERPPCDLDLRLQRLGKLEAVGQVGRDHAGADRSRHPLWRAAEIAIMHFAVPSTVKRLILSGNRSRIFPRPRLIHRRLRAAFARAVHEIDLRPLEIHLANQRAVE